MPSSKDGCSRRAVEVGHWEGEGGEILEREVWMKEREREGKKERREEGRDPRGREIST